MDASAIIAEQIPLLRSLHAQLALQPSALTEDTARIDAAVKAAILSVVRSREDEVAEWEAKIAEDKRILAGLGRAVGDQGRSVIAAGRRESEQGEALPAQHERLLRQIEELEKVYNERLEKIEELIATVAQLSILLGPPFEEPAPLKPIPGSSLVASRAPRQSMLPPPAPTHLAPTTNTSRRPSMMRAPTPVPQTEPTLDSWLDVGEEVMATIQSQLERALEERNARSSKLERHFFDLIWFHAELDLPDLLATSGSTFPLYLLPSQDQEEQPGLHARYERQLAETMSLNPWQPIPEEEEEAVELKGMDGIEPEIGLIAWCEQLIELWVAEKESRDARIQELYEQIEPLWNRLQVPQDVIDLFIESNRGSGLSTIQAYIDELDRVIEIRKSSLSAFVIGVRKEIAVLQGSLMMSDGEKADFGSFIDDNYTEELLEEHEAEAERLRTEVELRGPMLPRVKEWIALKADEEELERSAQDPNRFKKRGSAMLREEKMRKRVEKLKPKIEGELLQALPEWEEEHGRPFLAFGERIIDTIQDAIAAKEAAKEAKKRAKLGLTATTLTRGTTPAPATRSQPATRKRVAATPATGAGTSKRPRIIPSTAGNRVVSSASVMSTTSNLSKVSSGSVRPRIRQLSPSATPTATAAARTHTRMFGQPAVRAQANGAPPPPAYSSLGKPRPRIPATELSKPDGRRPRRESFRPRPSLAAGLLTGRGLETAQEVEELTEEDEDVF